ncbi:hypothetical protein GQ55_3G433500 [Panicum hallii var. hallii]|uniref:Mixed lineage kinase domain-containing protein n=1 Tax=Panicum hallii var. hallii TaxID=1504633 RepID=A0A2T7EHY8_9POAL|nr:hypothetical protein GQ55_3G433500 [Panicum hallii var. hallii]
MPVEWIPLVGLVLNVAARVGQYAGEALRYRKKCQLLRTRVQMISTQLRALDEAQWTPDPLATKDTLECLREVLGRAELLVVSCLRRKKAFDFLKTFKNKGEFAFVNQQISHIMEAFHLANHTLLLLARNDSIFMVVLDTLIKDEACRRLPQDIKNVLEESMSGLRHSDNMPPEKKRRLELIRRDLREGLDWDAAKTSSSGSRGQNQNDPVLKKVAEFAGEIVEEAKAVSHKKEEVQRVAQLAQKVIYLLPHLQPPLLTQNQATITKLLDNLKGAYQTITQQHRPLHCGPSALVPSSFWRQQAKRIAELGNTIEEAYQTLTLKVVRHITANA